MFSHYQLTVATAGNHRERLMDSARRHRLVFGRTSSDDLPARPVTLAEVVMLPARAARLSSRDARVA